MSSRSPSMKRGFMIGAMILLFAGFGIEYLGPKLSVFVDAVVDKDALIDRAYAEIERGRQEYNAERPDEEQLDRDHEKIVDARLQAEERIEGMAPPGFSLEADGLSLWVVFFSILVSTVGMFAASAGVIRGGSIASAVSSVAIIGLSVALIVQAVIELALMIGMITLAPFGFFVYLGVYGSFPKGIVLMMAGAAVVCKIVATALVYVGGPQLVRMRSSLFMFGTAFATFLLISIVLGIVPGIFASIADAVLGIIIAITAIVWAVTVLLSSVKGLTAKVL